MIDMTGKTLLVTGGGGGIGAACVKLAVELGGKVVLHDVRAGGAGEKLAKELGADKVRFVAADLADGTSVPRLWQEALAFQGRLDVLVNNAGIYEPADVSYDFAKWSAAWHRTLEICLVAPGHLCREAINSFVPQGGGIIVNIASRAGFRGDDPDFMHYAAAKGGVVAMTRTIARGYGKQGITCFAVAPGFVNTQLNKGFFDQYGVAGAAETIPLGEVAEPIDVARTVIFLASGHAKHATGTTVHINGASYVH